MADLLKRLLLAAAITLVAVALSSTSPAQQADEDPAPAAPHHPQSKSLSPAANQAETPGSQPSQKNPSTSSSNEQTQSG